MEISKIGENVQQHEDLVFDMRGFSPSSSNGRVNAIYYYVGDSENECDDASDFNSSDACCLSGAARTVVEHFDDSWSGCETFNILIDSGADASIFPSSVLGKGQRAKTPTGKLVDAQGVAKPVMATQDIEVCLKDVTGRTIRLKETVAISDKVGQPIMCFGHLLQSG